MVFYFSATGNSMYVARQIEDEPISIPQAIHNEKQEYIADSIGIVAPVYGHELPTMVKDFMKRAKFETDRAAHKEFLSRMSQMPEDAWQHLILVKNNCIGCGICEKVCPSGSIRIENGKAVPEVNPNARYRNEHISLQDIIEANDQRKGEIIQ